MGVVGVLNLFAKAKIRARVGRLADEDMVRLNRAVLVFLGIAAPTSTTFELRSVTLAFYFPLAWKCLLTSAQMTTFHHSLR
jgi:hypothetical protein